LPTTTDVAAPHALHRTDPGPRAGVFAILRSFESGCHMSMNPFRWSFRTRMLAASVACFSLIGFAVFSQLQWGLDPCPLCIFPRIAFAALGVVLLAAGLHAPRAAWGRRAWSLLSLVAAGVGASIAGRHVWIQLFPPPFPACGPPLDFLRETLSTGH